MTLVNTKQMLNKAIKDKFAICAFNIYNLESAIAAVESAKTTNKPIILAVSESGAEYAGFENLVAICSSLAKINNVKIALHLDHGKSYEVCKKAIDSGFTSVMIDGSSLSFEENIKLTKKVVKYAHTHDCTVEAELGKILGTEDFVTSNTLTFTDPAEAKTFVEQTNVDSLAISIGTAHGINKSVSEPKINFECIKEIRKLLPTTPLVAHGSSSVPKEFVQTINNNGGSIKKSQGIPNDTLKQMVACGINKVNMDTDIRLAFTSAIRKDFNENPSNFDPRKYLGKGKALAKEYMIKMINLITK